VLVFNDEERRPGFIDSACVEPTRRFFDIIEGRMILQILSRVPKLDNHSSALLHNLQLADSCGEL
jgi:hypothetical protein